MDATLATTEVATSGCTGNPGVFSHGPTCMGNPLSCAIADASISLLLSSNWKEKIRNIESRLFDGLAPAKQYDTVADVRVLGAIGVIEMKESVNMAKIQQEFVKEGIWVRPFGKLIYVMPPFIISDDELSFLITKLLKVTKEQ